ncbi:MAG: GDP-mannose 4,6-dehydratase [Christensenellaceae bacterium]|jgi:GDP-4-dehydro-6-deoxy-D-mannose reductase
MKALITGAGGFVGGYLADELICSGYEVIKTDIKGEVRAADLLNFDAVKKLIDDVRPDVVFHLAGQASVKLSWSNPQLTFRLNVEGTANLLDAVRAANCKAKILLIGSGDEYGKVEEQDCPIKETQPLKPQTPYAISKQAQEEFALLYARSYDMDIVMTRSFNHTGPGQQKGFVVPDFASRIAEIEKGAEPVIKVGNLKARRDFSDVRDIVRGYRLLAEMGKSGEIYNIGSGTAYAVKELLDHLIEISNKKIEVVEDPEKMRPVDTPLVVGDIRKIQEQTGYERHYSIEKTLEDTLDYWRKTVE